MDLYQSFIHKSRYARWIEDEGRRENWDETVGRYINFFKNRKLINKEEATELYNAILNMDVMPSMRALMTAGPALERENMAGYNCSYITCDTPRCFDETLYILMNGTGLGFSVESKYVNQLPRVAEKFEDTDTVIVVKDSKEGWASALKELINILYAGRIPKFDVSKVRPAGARLKTFGGRASGPDPLIDLFNFCINKFKGAAGRKLYPIEVHDIQCKIAEVVVVGGVRRSALISLSDLNDSALRSAKAGAWWETEPQRALANNSAVYEDKPSVGDFMTEWHSLYASKSGERGIFGRGPVVKHLIENAERRDPNHVFGTNPCSEILLRPNQVCNLTEVIVRPTDNKRSILKKVELATILGTLQATLTDFGFIRKRWADNINEERLLGVSLTGIMDCPGFHDDPDPNSILAYKSMAIHTNKIWAEKLGIPQSTAITCIKPSGTVSQLVNSASGIHSRHAPYYIRTVRGDIKDPLTQFLIDSGVPAEPDVMNPNSTMVFSFPQKSPEGSVFRNDRSAIEQLELWKLYQQCWCEHKASITVSVKEHEWIGVGSWVWDNFDYMAGVSFLPFSDHTYRQAPYQDCSEQEYNKAMENMPKEIDWSLLSKYETEDNTASSQTLACTGGVCEIVDIGNN